MGAVVYSINGKLFKNFGVFVSASEGLLDKPKPKPRKSYDWAESHGRVVDLSKPVYDEREITLKCWMSGDSWQQMKTNFDMLLSEFDKEGLARLVVDFGGVLMYDVYLSGEVELKKHFRAGRSFGEFTLKMKEPRPIKKVLKLTGGALQLSFVSPEWVEVNMGGMGEMVKGAVNIRKTLPKGIHYIVISGDIEKITNLQTNAEII